MIGRRGWESGGTGAGTGLVGDERYGGGNLSAIVRGDIIFGKPSHFLFRPQLPRAPSLPRRPPRKRERLSREFKNNNREPLDLGILGRGGGGRGHRGRGGSSLVSISLDDESQFRGLVGSRQLETKERPSAGGWRDRLRRGSAIQTSGL